MPSHLGKTATLPSKLYKFLDRTTGPPGTGPNAQVFFPAPPREERFVANHPRVILCEDVAIKKSLIKDHDATKTIPKRPLSPDGLYNETFGLTGVAEYKYVKEKTHEEIFPQWDSEKLVTPQMRRLNNKIEVARQSRYKRHKEWQQNCLRHTLLTKKTHSSGTGIVGWDSPDWEKSVLFKEERQAMLEKRKASQKTAEKKKEIVRTNMRVGSGLLYHVKPEEFKHPIYIRVSEERKGWLQGKNSGHCSTTFEDTHARIFKNKPLYPTNKF